MGGGFFENPPLGTCDLNSIGEVLSLGNCEFGVEPNKEIDAACDVMEKSARGKKGRLIGVGVAPLRWTLDHWARCP